MNTRILLFSFVISCFLVACNSTQTSAAPVKPIKVTGSATDDQKFSYFWGTQIGTQSSTFPEAFLAEFFEGLFAEGFKEARLAENDSVFKMQLPPDSLMAIGVRYQEKAVKVQQEIAGKPSPALNKTSKSLHSKLSKNSSDDEKFSYMWGVEVGKQSVYIGAELAPQFDADYFIQGVRDVRVSLRDTTKSLQLSKDTLSAVGMRYQQKSRDLQAAAQKKAMEEQEKVKQEVASMRGDTLENGMPKLMNYSVKVTGITAEAKTLEAFQGKPLFVFYFSTTCGHCQHAYPEIQKIADEFRKAGLTTIAIAAGSNSKKGILRFVEEQKAKDVIFIHDAARQFGELFSDGYVPKIYFVRPDGTYVLYKNFEKELDKVREDIRFVLNGK